MRRTATQPDRKARYCVDIDAFVYRADGSRLAVKLSDFSDSGCRIESDADFRIGEKIKIGVSRMGNMKAQIRWLVPGAAGTRFLTESDF